MSVAATETLFKLAVEQAPDSILITNQSGSILFVNAELEHSGVAERMRNNRVLGNMHVTALTCEAVRDLSNSFAKRQTLQAAGNSR